MPTWLMSYGALDCVVFWGATLVRILHAQSIQSASSFGQSNHSIVLVSRAYLWTLAVSVLAVTTAHCIAAARFLFIVFRCASCPKGLCPFGSLSFGRLYLLSLQVAKSCGSLSVPSIPSRGRVVGRSQLLNPSGFGSSRLACSTSAALLMCLALVSLSASMVGLVLLMCSAKSLVPHPVRQAECTTIIDTCNMPFSRLLLIPARGEPSSPSLA